MGKVGVIGAGSFGITVARLLSVNRDVLLFSRKIDLVEKINSQHEHLGFKLAENIIASNDISYICNNAKIIFLIVPSSAMRATVKAMKGFLTPSHIIIHGTKGFDTSLINDDDFDNGKFDIKEICTMSEVITQESTVLRVGCMAGPNLAIEILQGLPAATVIASEFDEVIKAGQDILSGKRFVVFGSYDIKGAEIAGAYKNIIAMAAGIVHGRSLGKNMEALLITRGLGEMIEFGTSLGYTGQAFFGAAGLGDLIATSGSTNSRNHTFGVRYAKGETKDEILADSSEVIEGVRTLKIIYHLSKNRKINLPIIGLLYRVIYEDFNLDRAIEILMSSTYATDVDFNIVK
jgi:glycerol-3-phosphate dehydrogenase (NAD(P)+)